MEELFTASHTGQNSLMAAFQKKLKRGGDSRVNDGGRHEREKEMGGGGGKINMDAV